MRAQEEKLQILATNWDSLPVIPQEVALLQAVGIPKQDAKIIMGQPVAPQRNQGFPQGGNSSRPQDHRAPAPPTCQITLTSYTLALPADCLLASD